MADLSGASDASVLLAFRGENVRSFRDEFEISLESTRLSDSRIVRYVQWRQDGHPIGVLPVAGIYGANGSGKSNVLKAIQEMRSLVLTSFRRSTIDRKLDIHSFALDHASRERPARFEVELVLNGVRHEYGFTATVDAVVEEWARRYPHGKASLIFRRKGTEIEFGSSIKVPRPNPFDFVRGNVLLLSVAGSTEFTPLQSLFEWFRRNLTLSEVRMRILTTQIAAELLDDPNTRKQLLALLHAADLGIVDVQRRKMNPQMRAVTDSVFGALKSSMSENLPEYFQWPELDTMGIRLTHQAPEESVEFEEEDESHGTIAWFSLASSAISSLNAGSVLMIDELDTSLHPALVAQVLRLFQDPTTNVKRAQLIFNSHDITTFAEGVFPLGRDQIWLAEKYQDGHTEVYSLADVAPRKDEPFGRRYLAGRYGGVPIISAAEFKAAIEQSQSVDSR